MLCVWRGAGLFDATLPYLLWILFFNYCIEFGTPIRCYCTDETLPCVPYGVCENLYCLVGIVKANNAVIRTCGDERINGNGCQKEVGKWSDLCSCDQNFCNTFSYLRANSRKERERSYVDDSSSLVFTRVDPPLGDFSTGVDYRHSGNTMIEGGVDTLVFVLVPFSVGCVVVIIVWINYYRNLC